MSSPTERSLKHLREAGWTVAKVEYWLAPARRRVDVWHFGDLLACKPDGRPTLVQTTSGSNVSARVAKAKEFAGPLVAWLLSGGALVVHGWAKRGARGEVKRWTLREVTLTVHDLVDDQPIPATFPSAAELPSGPADLPAPGASPSSREASV